MCREIVIDKLKLFKHAPDNIGDCQRGADQIPEEDFDEEAVEPVVELEDSKAREGFIQCVEMLPTSNNNEDLTIYKNKD